MTKTTSLHVKVAAAAFFLCVLGAEYWNHGGLQLTTAEFWCDGLFAAFVSLLSLFQVVRSFVKSGAIALFNPLLWAVLLYLLTILNQLVHREVTEITPEAAIFVLGLTLFQGMILWKRWSVKTGRDWGFTPHILVSLIFAIVAASVFHPDWSQWNQLYKYRGTVRWTGPFRNPNEFGALMALGLVLAAGLVTRQRLQKIRRQGDDPAQLLRRVGSFLAIMLTTVALVKSYSRGAWVGALLGFGYLVWSYRQAIRLWNEEKKRTDAIPSTPASKTCSHVFRLDRRNIAKLFVIFLSLIVISFWCFRNTDIRIVRRVFSVGNVYDASWRNRVDAYVGSLQIMGDHPWRGIGWAQPQPYYSEYYRKDGLVDPLAILLNDYLNIGMILGFPALACFLICLGLCFTNGLPNNDRQHLAAINDEWLKKVCRAGMLVLLVDLWSDTGLWPLHTDIPFWILLALGCEDFLASPAKESNAEFSRKHQPGWGKISTFRMFYQTNRLKLCLTITCLLAFVGAMAWAKSRDPFRRIPFSLGTAENSSLNGIALLPRSPARYPVAIYLHPAGNSLMTVGSQLRLLSGQNFAAVDIEYQQDNQAQFESEFTALHQFLKKQPWSQSDEIWIGSGVGADRLIQFALSRPAFRPQMLIGIEPPLPTEEDGPKNTDFNGKTDGHPGEKFPCPVLLLNSAADDLNPLQNCEKAAALLRSIGATVEIRTLNGASHTPDLDWPSIIRAIADYGATRTRPADYASYLSSDAVTEQQTQQFNRAMVRAGINRAELLRATASLPPIKRGSAMIALGKSTDDQLADSSAAELTEKYQSPSLWKVWTGIGIALVLVIVLWRRRNRFPPSMSPSVPTRRTPLTGILNIATLCFAVAALSLITLYLALPRLALQQIKPPFEKIFLRDARSKSDFQFLARQSPPGQNFGELLKYLQLAELQRQHFYTNLDEDFFRQFVLSPEIGAASFETAWRKQLWENLEPAIRTKQDPEAAAQIVVEILRQRVGVDPSETNAARLMTIWKRQMTNRTGFEQIYVAALRSIGIAAQLNVSKQTELWTGQRWVTAPGPAIYFLNSPD